MMKGERVFRTISSSAVESKEEEEKKASNLEPAAARIELTVISVAQRSRAPPLTSDGISSQAKA